jgi:hypothetical protein
VRRSREDAAEARRVDRLEPARRDRHREARLGRGDLGRRLGRLRGGRQHERRGEGEE